MIAPLIALALAGAAEPTRRYALVVGANDGGAERVELQFAHRDATSMASVLTELGGVNPEDLVLVYDPDVAELRVQLHELRQRAESTEGRVEVMFYYSGHSDETGLLLGEENYLYPSLRKELDELPADVRVAVLDSCASGALIRTKGGRKVAPFLMDASTDVGGLAVITSSSADESAQEADRIGGSYFTHYLTTGLRGAADRSSDGRVTLTEAYQYAFDETLARTEKTQHGPQHAVHEFQLSGTGDLVLTDLQLTSSTLVFADDLEGRALVRDASGKLVAELLKRPGQAVELGLADGKYDVTLSGDGSGVSVGKFELIYGQSTLIERSDLNWEATESTVARGGPVDRPGVVEDGMVMAIVPGWPNTDDVSSEVAVGALGVRVAEIDGIAAAGGWAESIGHTEGAMVSLGAVKTASLDGAAVSLGVASVEGHASGFVSALGVAHSGNLDGLALSLGVSSAKTAKGALGSIGGTFAGESMNGLQFAMGFNAIDGGGSGLQLAGVNSVHSEFVGMQLGGVNHSHEHIRGLQFGLINVGGTVGGAQIGLINVAKHVNGTQIGLINVADDVKGAPIGLLSVEKEGRHDLSVFVSEADVLNADFKLGGDHVYTLLGGGGDPGNDFYLAAGFGGHVPASEKVFLDFDVAFVNWQSVDAAYQTAGVGAVRGRAQVGYHITPWLAPIAGLQFTGVVYNEPDQLGPSVPAAPFTTPREGGTPSWPGIYAGLQF